MNNNYCVRPDIVPVCADCGVLLAYAGERCPSCDYPSTPHCMTKIYLTPDPPSPCCSAPVEGDYCSVCAKHIRVARIRELNDALRRSFIGRIVLTSGITSLGQPLVGRVCERVRAFEAFSAENDPHGEHDFGAFTLDGERVFFKIDYFDRALEGGSPDPSDEAVTTRVLSVMLAEEY